MALSPPKKRDKERAARIGTYLAARYSRANPHVSGGKFELGTLNTKEYDDEADEDHDFNAFSKAYTHAHNRFGKTRKNIQDVKIRDLLKHNWQPVSFDARYALQHKDSDERPINVVQSRRTGRHDVIDGFHRLAWKWLQGQETIKANVQPVGRARRMKKEETEVPSFRQFLDKPTMTPEAIAKKHGVPVADIERALVAGIRVEREHTSHDDVAREIALDHLAERPDYYQRLKKVEDEWIDAVVPPCYSGPIKQMESKNMAYKPAHERFLKLLMNRGGSIGFRWFSVMSGFSANTAIKCEELGYVVIDEKSQTINVTDAGRAIVANRVRV